MIKFKNFFLEYFKGNPITRATPRNGKNPYIDPSKRKHANIVPIKYQHKDRIVHNISDGKSNNVTLINKKLLSVLNGYGITFEPGIKTIGNSNVLVKLYVDNKGNKCGVLSRKE